jgi:hypothetical protein
MIPLARRQDWRLRDPKGRSVDEVRAIRDEIRGLVIQLIVHTSYHPRADFLRPFGRPVVFPSRSTP